MTAIDNRENLGHIFDCDVIDTILFDGSRRRCLDDVFGFGVSFWFVLRKLHCDLHF